MRTYELSYFISPELSNEEIEAISQRVIELVGSKDKIKNIGQPVRKKLGYPINKKIYATMSSLVFVCNAEEVKEIEKKLKNDNEIIRYMLILQKEKKNNSRTIKKFVIKPNKTQRKQEKVDLNRIDEKLEEMLDTGQYE